jgi:hypothetical protein
VHKGAQGARTGGPERGQNGDMGQNGGQNGDILQSPLTVRQSGERSYRGLASCDRGFTKGHGIGHPLRPGPNPAGHGPGDRPVRRP